MKIGYNKLNISYPFTLVGFLLGLCLNMNSFCQTQTTVIINETEYQLKGELIRTEKKGGGCLYVLDNDTSRIYNIDSTDYFLNATHGVRDTLFAFLQIKEDTLVYTVYLECSENAILYIDKLPLKNNDVKTKMKREKYEEDGINKEYWSLIITANFTEHISIETGMDDSMWDGSQIILYFDKKEKAKEIKNKL